MRKKIIQLEWIFDYYFIFLLYNSNKYYKYDNYMKLKWGDKYNNIKKNLYE